VDHGTNIPKQNKPRYGPPMIPKILYANYIKNKDKTNKNKAKQTELYRITKILMTERRGRKAKANI